MALKSTNIFLEMTSSKMILMADLTDVQTSRKRSNSSGTLNANFKRSTPGKLKKVLVNNCEYLNCNDLNKSLELGFGMMERRLFGQTKSISMDKGT